jgi:CheY-like chemotaxis protein
MTPSATSKYLAVIKKVKELIFMNDNIHILLVEDNEGDIFLTKEALSEGRMINRLSIVKDGESALKFLAKEFPYEDAEYPQLILLDINLPKVNGKEVLDHIKKTEKIKHIPVVMLTTSSSPNDILDSYKKQASCYITKPVDLDKFVEMLRSFENFWISTVQLPPCL